MENEANAKRARRAADSGFLQLLRANTPPATGTAGSPSASPLPLAVRITEDTSFDALKAALADDAAWQVRYCDRNAGTNCCTGAQNGIVIQQERAARVAAGVAPAPMSSSGWVGGCACLRYWQVAAQPLMLTCALHAHVLFCSVPVVPCTNLYV